MSFLIFIANSKKASFLFVCHFKMNSIGLQRNVYYALIHAITFWAIRLATMSLAWTSMVHKVMIFCRSPVLSSPSSMPINKFS